MSYSPPVAPPNSYTALCLIAPVNTASWIISWNDTVKCFMQNQVTQLNITNNNFNKMEQGTGGRPEGQGTGGRPEGQGTGGRPEGQGTRTGSLPHSLVVSSATPIHPLSLPLSYSSHHQEPVCAAPRLLVPTSLFYSGWQ